MCIPYEEASRIPLIIRYPPLLGQGVLWRSGVSLVDLMPTILEVAGVEANLRGGGPLHGRSLLTARDQWQRPIIMQNVPQRGIDGSYYDERALRTGNWKLILRKFDVRPELRPGELYDMDADPAETRNLYTARAEVVKQLGEMLRRWGDETEDPLSVELGRYATK
jgi:arylsulfatase A-like enzyme